MLLGDAGNDDVGTDAGAVYAFEDDAGTWTQTQTLYAGEGGENQDFGRVIATDGDVMAVGAHGVANRPGEVFIYAREGDGWIKTQTLRASDGHNYDLFGYDSIEIDANRMVVGAYYNNEYGSQAGAVYVFEYDGSFWVEQQKLVSGDLEAGDWFAEVAIDGDTIVVGANGDDLTELGGDPGANHGSAYIFSWNGTQWVQQAKLHASDWNTTFRFGNFGGSVDLLGDLVLVGEFWEQNVTGAAYVFQRVGGTWTEVQN